MRKSLLATIGTIILAGTISYSTPVYGGERFDKIKRSVKQRGAEVKDYMRKNQEELAIKALEKINPGAGPAIKGFKRYRKEFDQYKERRKKRPRSGGVMMGTGVVRKENWD